MGHLNHGLIFAGAMIGVIALSSCTFNDSAVRSALEERNKECASRPASVLVFKPMTMEDRFYEAKDGSKRLKGPPHDGFIGTFESEPMHSCIN